MDTKQSFGLQVRVRFKEDGPFGLEQTYYNVTEIHYRYGGGHHVALESDVHQTGATLDLDGIQEFEATSMTSKAEQF